MYVSSASLDVSGFRVFIMAASIHYLYQLIKQTQWRVVCVGMSWPELQDTLNPPHDDGADVQMRTKWPYSCLAAIWPCRILQSLGVRCDPFAELDGLLSSTGTLIFLSPTSRIRR